jgi:hypothetical protein
MPPKTHRPPTGVEGRFVLASSAAEREQHEQLVPAAALIGHPLAGVTHLGADLHLDTLGGRSQFR